MKKNSKKESKSKGINFMNAYDAINMINDDYNYMN